MIARQDRATGPLLGHALIDEAADALLLFGGGAASVGVVAEENPSSFPAARPPGGAFFLQIGGFFRAAVVSPASARFPMTVATCLAVRHRTVPGGSTPPVRILIICSGFFAIGRRA